MSDKKVLALLTTLTEKTEDGTIRWQHEGEPVIGLTISDAKIVDSYTTQYGGKMIGLMHIRERDYSSDLDEYYYATRFRLVFLRKTIHGLHVEYTVPDMYGTSELFESVQRQEAGVDDYLDRVLADAEATRGESKDKAKK